MSTPKPRRRRKATATRPVTPRRPKWPSRIRSWIRIGLHIVSDVWAVIGAGMLPGAAWWLMHHDARESWPLYGLVLAALAYSAPKVYRWAGRWLADQSAPGEATGSAAQWQSLSFVLLTEGVSVFALTTELSLAALALLVGINAISAALRVLDQYEVTT